MVTVTTEGDGLRLEAFKKELHLHCDWGVGIGGSVWTSGLLLLDYLERNEAEMRQRFAGKRVIDLGSGTGLVGLGISLLGPQEVFLTDLSSHLDVIRENVKRNQQHIPSKLQVEELIWGQPAESLQPPFDVVVGTDVVYHRELYQPFIAALEALSGERTQIYVGASRADTDLDFFRMLEDKGFSYYKVPDREVSPEFRGKDFGIFKVTR